jgi:hypothetical protein
VRVDLLERLSWTPVSHQQVLASGSDQPTTISFDPIATTEVRLDTASRTRTARWRAA